MHYDRHPAGPLGEGVERVVLGRSRVYDERLADGARELDLRLERSLLIGPRGVVAVVVEPGLADRHRLRVRGGALDRLEVGRRESLGGVRVPPDDRVHLVMRICELEGAPNRGVVDTHRRDPHEPVAACVLLLAHVEVAMGVDHGRWCLTSRTRSTESAAGVAVDPPAGDRVGERRHGPLAGGIARVEHQVDARLGGAHPDLGCAAERRRRGCAERIGHRNAVEAQAHAQLIGRDGRRERGRPAARPAPCRWRCSASPAEPRCRTAAGTAARPPRGGAEAGTPMRTRALSVFWPAAPKPGKCFGLAKMPRSWRPVAKASARRATFRERRPYARRSRSMALPRRATSTTGARFTLTPAPRRLRPAARPARRATLALPAAPI